MDSQPPNLNIPPPTQHPDESQAFVPVSVEEKDIHHLPPSDRTPAPWWTWMIPGARRAYQIRNLQAGTAEVMHLVRSIHDSLEQQVEAQRQLVASLSSLPDAVEGLKNIGKATEAQREMMTELHRQMNANAGTMERFNDTLISMDGTTKSLAQHAKTSENALFDMLHRAQRRMTVLTLLLVLTIGSVAALFGYLMTGGTLPSLKKASPHPSLVTPEPPPVPHETPALPPPPSPEGTRLPETIPAEPVQPEAAKEEPTPPVAPTENAEESPEAIKEDAHEDPSLIQADATPAGEDEHSDTPAVEHPTEEPEAPSVEEPAREEESKPTDEKASVQPDRASETPSTPAAPNEEPKPPTEAALRLERLLKELREKKPLPAPETPADLPLE